MKYVHDVKEVRMCHHIFYYPEDTRDNYNLDDKTLTGVCRRCGIKKKAYGMGWALLIEESFKQDNPYGKTQFNYIDKTRIIC